MHRSSSKKVASKAPATALVRTSGVPAQKAGKETEKESERESADEDHPSKAERIWQVVAAIPPGKVATYGQVAELAGLSRGARLVGRTLSQLPQGSTLPWFRVLNARGELSFPKNSAGWRRQRDKLKEDGVLLQKGRLNLRAYRWQP